jgi:type II secretion system protein H
MRYTLLHQKSLEKFPQQTKQTGFTLIELLVVVAIIGIVTTLITFNIGNWINTKQTKTEAQRLIVEIQALLDQAVISQTPIGLVIKSHEIEIYSQQDNQWETPKPPAPESIVISEGIKLLAPIYTTQPSADAEDQPKQPLITLYLGTDGRISPYRLGIEDSETRCYLAINQAGGIEITDCIQNYQE